MRLIVWLQLQQIMHGKKIDVKRKIYLVSIEKIDSNGELCPQQRLLLPIIVRVDKNIQRYPAALMRMILVIIFVDCYHPCLLHRWHRRRHAAARISQPAGPAAFMPATRPPAPPRPPLQARSRIASHAGST